jgi:hypothetical protein
MAKRGEWVPVKRGDHERVVITETLPYETPIIFSGDGFYNRLKHASSSGRIHSDLVENLVFRHDAKPGRVTIPFSYKIRKGTSDFRRLAVLHPSALWDVREFYEKYDEWMIYECGRSPFSIRAPFKISGSFYQKSDSDAMNQFKQGQISTVDVEGRSRYNPSYFVYRGFTRLYRFFSSNDFLHLEQRYRLLRTLDVSRCFDSIYTHSIAWALMGKAVAKEAKRAKTSANAFDELMRSVNHGETSGIVIGPEISRIFAEMIFQTIDLIAIRTLDARSYRYGHEYSIRRYVDDVFIFADSTAIAEQVSEAYTDAMASFNLYTNPHKVTSQSRPFVTKKSSVINEARVLVDDLSSRIFENYERNRSQLRPAEIWQSDRITIDFITSIKSICLEDGGSYNDSASYLISAFCERTKRLVKRKKALNGSEEKQYCTVISILLKLMFFLYTVSPSVNASYRLSVAVALMLRFARRRLPLEATTIEQLIYSESFIFLSAEERYKTTALSQFVSLEAINVLLVIRELGEPYFMPVNLTERIFTGGAGLARCAEWCYFDIVTCLFYVGNRSEYGEIKRAVIAEVDKRLSEMDDVNNNAEKTYLLLDMLTCPYVSNASKSLWIDRFGLRFSLAAYGSNDLQRFLADCSQNPWFINWEGVDILTLLQRKEVVQAY